MLGNTWNLLSHGNKGWEPHWIYPEGKREPCSRWHGRWQPQNWNPETVTSNRASCHYVTIKWGGKERQMSSCPFPCFFTETDEFQQIPDSCLLWTPSQIHSLPLSQRTQNFNVLPDLSWQKSHRTAGLNQSAGVEREAKTLASYNQSPSLVLFLKPCLHLCIVLNLYYTLYLT